MSTPRPDVIAGFWIAGWMARGPGGWVDGGVLSRGSVVADDRAASHPRGSSGATRHSGIRPGEDAPCSLRPTARRLRSRAKSGTRRREARSAGAATVAAYGLEQGMAGHRLAHRGGRPPVCRLAGSGSEPGAVPEGQGWRGPPIGAPGRPAGLSACCAESSGDLAAREANLIGLCKVESDCARFCARGVG